MYVRFLNDRGHWMVPFTNITGFLAYYDPEDSFGNRTQVYGMLYGNDQSYELNLRSQLDNVREQLEKEWAPEAKDDPPEPPPPPPAPEGPKAVMIKTFC